METVPDQLLKCWDIIGDGGGVGDLPPGENLLYLEQDGFTSVHAENRFRGAVHRVDALFLSPDVGRRILRLSRGNKTAGPGMIHFLKRAFNSLIS
jgi:hypothetical protein